MYNAKLHKYEYYVLFINSWNMVFLRIPRVNTTFRYMDVVFIIQISFYKSFSIDC